MEALALTLNVLRDLVDNYPVITDPATTAAAPTLYTLVSSNTGASFLRKQIWTFASCCAHVDS